MFEISLTPEIHCSTNNKQKQQTEAQDHMTSLVNSARLYSQTLKKKNRGNTFKHIL